MSPLIRTCSALLAVVFTAAPLAAQQNSRTWEIVPTPTNLDLTTLNYGNGMWLSLGRRMDGFGNFTSGLFRSQDGLTWQMIPSVTGFLNDINFAPAIRFVKDRFLANLSTDGMTVTWKQSTDGQTWTDFPVPFGSFVSDVIYANGLWVCGGGIGLFATATVPGNWTVNGSALTSSTITHLAWLGGKFYAFSQKSTGMDIYSSPDGLTWGIDGSMSYFFSSLSQGEIEKTDGTVESVLVVTSNSATYAVGKISADRLVWENRTRTTFGRLTYRRSADATRPGQSRREWVHLDSSLSQPGVQIHMLQASGETPILEEKNSLNRILAVAMGPDAMIGVGTGGLIRRYPTALAAPTVPAGLTIQPAVQLKWTSRTGASYKIEESTDMILWQTAQPAPLIGNGGPMIWTVPAVNPGRFFRVRES